jgi:tetratricopeptide (TPR) repeat protein
MRFSAAAVPLLLAGCLLKDYRAGLSAYEAERWGEAAAAFERSLYDADMRPDQRLRAAGLFFESYERLDRWEEARRALDRGADLLLADYRILDMSAKERAAIHPALLFRYHSRVGEGALAGLDRVVTAPLREKKVEMAELHFRRALEIDAPTPLRLLLRGELVATLLEAMAAVGRRSKRDWEELRRIVESDALRGGVAVDALKARADKLR